MINDNRQRQLLKRRTVFLSFLLLLVSVSIPAQTPRISAEMQEIKDFNRPVSVRLKTTYIELIRRIFPDAKIEAGKFAAGDSIALRSLNPKIGIRTFERGKLIAKVLQIQFSSENKKHLALFFNLKNESAVRSLQNSFFVLATFRMGKEIELVDAVDAQFISQHQNVNLWSETPLLPLRDGDDGIWLAALRENSSGNRMQDFRLVALRNKKLEIILDELPTLKGISGCGFLGKQFPGFFVRKDNSAKYRDVSLTVTEILRSNTIKCEVQPPADYDKTFAYRAVWNETEKRYKVEFLSAKAIAVAPTKNSADFSAPLEFAGKMEVGKTYRAEIGCRGNPEWQLKIEPRAPENGLATVSWSASGLTLPRAKLLTEEQCNASILFKVLKATTEPYRERLRTNYECEIKAVK